MDGQTQDQIGEKKLKSKHEEDETVQISKARLDEMFKRLERLENPGIIQKPKRVTQHTAILREWEGKLVVEIGKMKTDGLLHESDPMKYQIPIVLLDLEGKEDKKSVPFLHFFETAGKVPVKILKSSRVERVMVDERYGGGGVTNKAAIDKEGRFTDTPTMEEIELAVTYVDLAAEVEVNGGPFEGKVISFPTERMSALNA